MTEKEQKASEILQEIAKNIKEKLPENMGFALLTYEFTTEETEGQERKMLYISNSNRLDVMNAMCEFLEKNMEDPKMFGEDK